MIKGIQDVFAEQRPIDRTLINSWQDKHFVEAIRKTGRKQLVLAALYTEICLAMTAVHALAAGFDVFFVTDASGGASVQAHDMPTPRIHPPPPLPLTSPTVPPASQLCCAP